MKGALKQGVKSICFSSDGTRIAAVALDIKHHVAVYDIAKIIELRKNPEPGVNAEDEGLVCVT